VPALVLASTSRYRRGLLERLGVAFAVADPQLDEAALPGELPAARAERLARAKALAVAGRFPAALIIGSDQVASIGGEVLHKPGSHERARDQLRRASGRQVLFHTAVTVHNPRHAATSVRVVPCRVDFRSLSEATIEQYLRLEQPYDCAGSAKAEGLGIALIERVLSDDPTALIGLPLIALCELLAEHGLAIPASSGPAR
jgi:septum formation protein